MHVHGGEQTTIKDVDANLVQPNQWFTLQIIVVRQHFVVKLNGQLVAEADDPANTYERGHIALHRDLQSRGGELSCRKVDIRVPDDTKLGKARTDAGGVVLGQGRFLPIFSGNDPTGWDDLLPKDSGWKQTLPIGRLIVKIGIFILFREFK